MTFHLINEKKHNPWEEMFEALQSVLRSPHSRLEYWMLSVDWRDGVELLADVSEEEAYSSEDEEEGEDEWVEVHGYIRKKRSA